MADIFKDIPKGEVEDEVSVLALYFSKMLEIIETLITTIKNQTEVMTSVSSKLAAVSKQLANGSVETVSQSDVVASTVRQIYTNMNIVVATIEEMNRTVCYLKSTITKFKE